MINTTRNTSLTKGSRFGYPGKSEKEEATHERKPQNRKPPQKHSVNQFDFDESEEEILSISCTEEEINTVDNHPNKILAFMKSGGKEVKMLIDSGASKLQCSAHQVFSPKELWLRNRVTSSRCTQSQPCQPLVKQKIFLVNPKNMESYLIDFTIVDGNFAPLLGLETAQQMKLLVVQTQNILSIREETAACDAEKPEFTKDAVMSEYSDVFGEELGSMKGKVHLESDPNVAPS